MRVAISNIAWDPPEDEAVAGILERMSIDAIDVAPGKYFPQPSQATDADIARVKKWWLDRGIRITGMQALLFGTTGLNVFGAPASQDALLQHLTAVCRIGAGLDGTRLVFGSPKNRDRTGLSDEETLKVAVPFFRRLGDVAQSFGVLICLEPNPVRYGANFMTTTTETARVVERVDHPAIKMQLDTGALTINGEDPVAVLEDCASLVAHVHASEPDLVPLGDGGGAHAQLGDAVAKYLPNHVVTVEMVATKNEPHPQSIERALGVAVRNYRR